LAIGIKQQLERMYEQGLIDASALRLDSKAAQDLILNG
jgi:hypothetical protein